MWRAQLNVEGDLTGIVSIEFQYSLTPTVESSWTRLVEGVAPLDLPYTAVIPHDDASLRALVFDAGGAAGNPVPLWTPTKPITVQDLKDALGLTGDQDDTRLYRYLHTALPALWGRLTVSDLAAEDIPTGSRIRAGMVLYLAGSYLSLRQAGQAGVEKRMGTYSVKHSADPKLAASFLADAARLLGPWWVGTGAQGTLAIPRATYGAEEESFA